MLHANRFTILTILAIELWGPAARAQSQNAGLDWTPAACTSDAQCNDANPCTADLCIAGRCDASPLLGSCNDGNACTSGDRCQAGSCEGVAIAQCDAPVTARREAPAAAGVEPRTLAELPRLLQDYTVVERDVMTPGEPYVVQGTLTVEFEAQLTIRPGTVVRFDPGAKLLVNGDLAAASPAQDIVFQSNAEAPTPGSWQGVEIGATAFDVRLDGVVIEDAVTPVLIAGGGTPDELYRVRNCVLRNFSGNAVQSGRMTSPVTSIPGSRKTGMIADNRIQRSAAADAPRTGTGVSFVGSQDPAFQLNPTISGNEIRGFDLGIAVAAGGSASITGNRIAQNNVGVQIRDASPRITDGNRITDNARGISRTGQDGARPVVNGNAIFGNAGLNYESFGAASERDPFRAALFQDAELNYWGTTDPLAIAAKVSLGRGMTSRPVDFVPFLDAENGQPVTEDGMLIGVLRPVVGSIVSIPAGSNVLLLGNALVPAGTTLEIGAGSTVRAVASQGLGVDGTLHIQGQPLAPVILAPVSMTWLGIDIRPGSTGSVIDGAVIQGVRPLTGLIAQAAIDVRGSELALSNSTLMDFTVAGVAYRDGARGRIQGVAIDNSLRLRSGAGIQISGASPDVLGNRVANTATGIGVSGRSTSLLSGNTVTANTVGILLEGTPTADPMPRINRNNLFANTRGSTTQNLVVDRFAATQTTPVDARENYWGLMTEAEIRATIVNRGTAPVTVDVSGFLSGPVNGGS